MDRLSPVSRLTSKVPMLAGFLDKVIHPLRDSNSSKGEHDPGKPFTPPPSQPSRQEKEDDDDDGPTFPMDPALA